MSSTRKLWIALAVPATSFAVLPRLGGETSRAAAPMSEEVLAQAC